jgi:hypothetical protein
LIQSWREALPAPAGGDLAQQTVTSAGGERFHAFAKATTPGRDVYLYEDAIAPFYGTGAARVASTGRPADPGAGIPDCH